ncbi:MAG: helix-turn-helix transcriptional regulator [Akkermansiaceae bacterium]|nr:helix-turn-helix transcriptional regulator [Armatimonadota bacterium]
MPPTLTQLAEMAGVHPSHLLRAFRQQYHLTPGEFVRRLRIEEACRRLRSGQSTPLSVLALDLGFSDQSHFIRIFRSIVGVTPGAYRKMHPV